jgi:hypothetical protein
MRMDNVQKPGYMVLKLTIPLLFVSQPPLRKVKLSVMVVLPTTPDGEAAEGAVTLLPPIDIDTDALGPIDILPFEPPGPVIIAAVVKPLNGDN